MINALAQRSCSVRLREVGLITSRREGRMIYHRLRAQLLLSLGSDALTTVMR